MVANSSLRHKVGGRTGAAEPPQPHPMGARLAPRTRGAMGPQDLWDPLGLPITSAIMDTPLRTGAGEPQGPHSASHRAHL